MGAMGAMAAPDSDLADALAQLGNRQLGSWAAVESRWWVVNAAAPIREQHRRWQGVRVS